MDPEVVPPDSTLQTLVYGSFLYRWSCWLRTKGTWTNFNALLFALDRQRKEKQDLKASKRFYKNRHELYADELVGCWAIRIILYHRAALQAFDCMFPCMFDPPGASDHRQEPRTGGRHGPRGRDHSEHQRFLPRCHWEGAVSPSQSPGFPPQCCPAF